MSRQQIVGEMVGEAADTAESRRASALGETMLEVRGLGVFEPEGKMRVTGLDLTVRKGEVVGLFGLLGAGCIEAALAIYGAYPDGARARSSSMEPKRRSTAPIRPWRSAWG